MPFSQKTLTFLVENRINDSRDWFHDHDEDYRSQVIAPLKELVTALSPAMLQIDREFVTEPRICKTISRIWRDTRFSHDPALYRDNMWITFRRPKSPLLELPGFYFEINPDGFGYGCGLYSASPAYMNILRSMILEGEPLFKKAKAAYEKQKTFHMEGEKFKRARFPDQPQAHREWLERRGLSFNAESHDFSLLFSQDLPSFLAEGFGTLAPIYHFMAEAALRLQLQTTSGELAARGR